jgi:choline kinase
LPSERLRGGIAAAGLGRRLLAGGRSSKALAEVAGQSLIDYVLDAYAEAQVPDVTVVVRPDDGALRRKLEGEGRFARVDIIDLPPSSSLDATLALVDRIGDEDFVLSTCDVVCPSDLVKRLLKFVRRAKAASPLLVVVASPWAGEAEPVWVQVEGSSAVDIGKELEPCQLVFGNVRWVSRDLKAWLEASPLPASVSRDSEFMGWLCRQAPGAVMVATEEGVFDVDTPEDVERVERLRTRGGARGTR